MAIKNDENLIQTHFVRHHALIYKELYMVSHDFQINNLKKTSSQKLLQNLDHFWTFFSEMSEFGANVRILELVRRLILTKEIVPKILT